VTAPTPRLYRIAIRQRHRKARLYVRMKGASPPQDGTAWEYDRHVSNPILATEFSFAEARSRVARLRRQRVSAAMERVREAPSGHWHVTGEAA
jgi:hypothetical protein